MFIHVSKYSLLSLNVAGCGGAGTTRLLSVGGRKGDCGGGCFLFCFRL